MRSVAKMMRAVTLLEHGPASSLFVREVKVPAPDLAQNQLLIHVKAAGINPVDTYIRAGTNNYKAIFPHTPGRDGAGIVISAPSGSEFAAGQRVYFSSCITGSAAEYTVCSAAHTFPLPSCLSFEEGACLGVPYITAHRALGRCQAKAGDRVLIHGATGAVGIAAVQLAKSAGMVVFGSSGSDAGNALLAAQDVDFVLDHRNPDHLMPFMTAGAGFDAIIEMAAHSNLGQDIKALAPGGVVVVVGNRGDVQICPRDLMARDASITGVSLANIKPPELKRIAQSLHPLLGVMLKPVVRRTYSLEGVGEAHEDVLKAGALGNLVISLA
jgi:NADPH2:quinone reductase